MGSPSICCATAGASGATPRSPTPFRVIRPTPRRIRPRTRRSPGRRRARPATDMTANICVLGGTGFVGTELVAHLARAGYWVRVPTRNPAHGQHLRVLSTVELVTANVHDPRTLGQLVAGMDTVVDLIGILNASGRATFQQVHTDLAAKLIAAARGAKVRRLLQMSA